MIVKNNFYIITGGPGSGKTALWKELQRRKFNCVPEVARAIIKDQMATDGKALPWEDARQYAKLMLAHSVRDFINLLDQEDVFFFDRGIPDTYGYAQLMNFDKDDNLLQAAKNYKYNKIVFILEPWEAIYETDAERKEDFKLAMETYLVLKSTYVRLGYELIEVPCLPVCMRADFILTVLSNLRS
jgi:predicted ATPase